MSIEVKIVSSMLSPKLSSTKIFQTRLVSVEQQITWDGNYKFREWPSCSMFDLCISAVSQYHQKLVIYCLESIRGL